MINDPNQVPIIKHSNYPDCFKSLVSGREKQRLGEAVGLQNFGVNLTTLLARSRSSLQHWHLKQDEFIYVLSGELTVISSEGEYILKAGQFTGFPAGKANGHYLYNHTEAIATYLEIGDRTPDDQVSYCQEDLVATMTDQGWQFSHRDGTLYENN